jgi:hypothetical protein
MMAIEQCQLQFAFESSFCNAWPEISIIVNDEVLWQGFVEKQARVDVSVPMLDNNFVVIRYLNKRNGPEIWDTKMDSDGNITEDQHCVLKTVRVKGCRCDFLIKDMQYRYLDGTEKNTFGFMDLRGYFMFKFPQEVETWVLESRRRHLPHVNHNSSLAYETIYVPDNDNVKALEIVQELKILLENIHD